MKYPREGICRICFGVLLAVGVGFVFHGLIVVPASPYFQLDILRSRQPIGPSRRNTTPPYLF